jgi:hypothetical protein
MVNKRYFFLVTAFMLITVNVTSMQAGFAGKIWNKTFPSVRGALDFFGKGFAAGLHCAGVAGKSMEQHKIKTASVAIGLLGLSVLAASQCSGQVVSKTLLHAGIKINCPSLMHIACHLPYAQKNLLGGDPAVISPLIRATMNGSKDIEECLLRCGVDANEKIHEGHYIFETALSAAIACGQDEIARLLLAHGANPSLEPSPNKLTTLQLAVMHRNLPIIKDFVEQRGVDINGCSSGLRSLFYMSPLQIANKFECHEIVAYLQSKGAQ